MRFYLDEDLSDVIATIAQEYFALDVWSSHACDMDGSSDEEQLNFATMHGRAIVTNNRDDFWKLSAEFIERGRQYSTILIATNIDTGQFIGVARALSAYHQHYPHDDFIPLLVDYLHPADDLMANGSHAQNADDM